MSINKSLLTPEVAKIKKLKKTKNQNDSSKHFIQDDLLE